MKDRAEARRLWCEKEKASFVAVKLDAHGAVDLFPLPGKRDGQHGTDDQGKENYCTPQDDYTFDAPR